MMIESTMTVRVSAAVPHCCPMWSSSEEVAGAIHVASCRLSHAGGLVLPWWRCFSPFTRGFESLGIARKPSTVVACAAKGPRPRYARVWKTNRRIGTISKAAKLLQRIKGLSNVKEEVYGALDAFIAWELEFPLIAVRKAINSLEEQKEWKRVIQVIKWMFSKGHGRTMRTYSALLNALAEDGRIEEAGELWTKLFAENLESMPRNLCDRMIAIYYRRDMYSKMFEIFADMEELGIQPNKSIVSMMGKAFRNLGMLDKYAKLKRKYPRPIWKYRYFRGKRVRVRAKNLQKHGDGTDEGAITMSNWSMVQMKQLEGSESISNKDGVVLEEEEDQDPNELSEEVEVISTVKTRG